MKIVFLDFDGVLNSNRWVRENIHLIPANHLFMHNNLDHAAVARVEKIVQASGAKVVISSTWRLLNPIAKLRDILKNHGFTGEVVDITPRLGTARGNEIADWLNKHGPVESFVILDDDSDMVHLKHRLVQTSWDFGLLDEHVAKAIEMLGDSCTNAIGSDSVKPISMDDTLGQKESDS